MLIANTRNPLLVSHNVVDLPRAAVPRHSSPKRPPEAPGGLPFLHRPVARYAASATRLTSDDERGQRSVQALLLSECHLQTFNGRMPACRRRRGSNVSDDGSHVQLPGRIGSSGCVYVARRAADE